MRIFVASQFGSKQTRRAVDVMPVVVSGAWRAFLLGWDDDGCNGLSFEA
jgi:hypothetical protein